jgi:hypothetical protein
MAIRRRRRIGDDPGPLVLDHARVTSPFFDDGVNLSGWYKNASCSLPSNSERAREKSQARS